MLVKDKSSNTQQQLLAVVQALESGLSYQYHMNWDIVFQVLAVTMEVFFVNRSISNALISSLFLFCEVGTLTYGMSHEAGCLLH